MRRILASGALLILLAACGGQDQELVGEGAAPTAAPGDVAPGAADAVDPDREVVYTADLTVRADDVAAAAERATEIAEEADGFLLDSETFLEGDTSSRLTLRVPPAAFDAVLDGLAALGTVTSRSVRAEDVTEQVVDAEVRLDNARASVARLRELLADAATVPDVVAIEGELSAREADVESFDAQLRSLRARVDLTTITLQLIEPARAEIVDDIPGFPRGLRSGAVALVNLTRVALATAGFLLPFVPPVLLLVYAVHRYRRWRRARPRAVPPPRPTTPPPAGGPWPGWPAPAGGGQPAPPPARPPAPDPSPAPAASPAAPPR